MRRNIILHIGMEKTGTTTIQKFCAVNRNELNKRGIAYPRTLGEENHRSLATYAMNLQRYDDSHNELNLTDAPSRQAYNILLERKFAEEIQNLPSSIHTLILSNEHCHSRLYYVEELQRLQKMLTNHAENIRVLVYLRRQDEVAVSLYSTGLRADSTRFDIFPNINKEPDIFRHFFNYDHSIALWEQVFGSKNVEVRIFDKSSFPNHNIVFDFLSACGITATSMDGFRHIKNMNESIQAPAQEFLRQMNEFFPRFIDKKANKKRWKLPHLIAEAFPGSGRMPPRTAAISFMLHFVESNEKLRQRKFPNRPTLFSTDFDKYPEQAQELSLTFGDAVKISAKLWEQVMNEVEALETENERLKN